MDMPRLSASSEDTGDLPLDLAGISEKITSVVTCEILGVVEEADLAAALARGSSAEPPAPTGSEDDLKKIREKHHHVARLLAQGLSQTMVAALSGYTDSYLSILLNTPAMTELVEFYRARYNPAHEVMVEKLRTVGGKALEELDRRLEAEANAFDVSELVSVGKLALDRAGHGPSSNQHIIKEEHLFDHAELQRKNREARQASKERIIEPPSALPAPQPPSKDVDDAGTE